MDPKSHPKSDKKDEDALRSTTVKPKSLLEFKNEAQSGENDRKSSHMEPNQLKINKGSAA